MGLQIEDGTGSGKQVGVDSENRFKTASVTNRKMTSVSEIHGEAYCWTTYQATTGDVNAIWLRNDSNTNRLHIDHIDITPPTTTSVYEIWVGNGNTSGGTGIAGVNLNRSAGNSDDATCAYKNTNVDAGAGMTLLGTYGLPALTISTVNLEGALILGVNREIAINVITAGGASAINVFGYFHEAD